MAAPRYERRHSAVHAQFAMQLSSVTAAAIIDAFAAAAEKNFVVVALSLSLGIDVQILQIILATDESPLAVLSAPRAPRYGLCR